MLRILGITVCMLAALDQGGAADDGMARRRRAMVENIERYDRIDRHDRWDPISPAVLDVMGRVERHRFVPDDLAARAYDDRPLPIGHGQTISQPLIVALMTHLLQVAPGDTILEIGTGCGYQAAVLAEMGAVVHSIEIVPELARDSKTRLAELGYDAVTVYEGDGYLGLPESAPFDAVLVTAAPDHVPDALVEQLRSGGRMVVPVGPPGGVQELKLLTKAPDGRLNQKRVLPVRFVPMIHGPQD